MTNLLQKLSLKTLAASTLAAAATLAAAPAAAQVAYNLGATTDYRYRGISQSRLKPAIQGGVDYTQGPFYVGAWASSIQWIRDFGGKGRIELDLYGGYKGEITKGLTYDVGVLSYVYPENGMRQAVGANANTTEIYGAMTYSIYTAKYSHALTNTFANIDSKQSFYIDLSAALDIGGGWTMTPHLGYQKIKGPFSSLGSYADYSLAVSKDFSGFVVTGAVVGTDADKSFYASPANGKFLGRTGVTLGVKYNF